MDHPATPAPRHRPLPGLRVGAAVLVLSLVAAACGGDDAASDLSANDLSANDLSANDLSANDSAASAPASGGTTPSPAGTSAGGDGPAGPGDGAATGPIGDLALTLTPVATLSQPIALAPHPGSDDLYLAERGGRIRRLARTVGPDGDQVQLTAEPVLDIGDQITTEGEGGLLGLAFAPGGDALYVDYTDADGDTVVAGYPVTAGPEGITVDVSGRRQLLTVDQPYPNHNGGDLQFGPDGLLYITLGDGGGGGDPERTGQDPTDLLGSVLRIDPTPGAGTPYTIPADNPFADGADGAPEVWLWGVRNPWRISFDPATGDLWVADVGQNAIEEIDFLPAADGAGRGANLGWNLMEGNESYAGDPPPDHVGPVHTYTHDNGRCSVTGGQVHRGPGLPALNGVYLFADYCSGELFGLEGAATGDPRASVLFLDRPAGSVIAFGQDAAGEVYVLQQGGQVSRLSPAEGGRPIEVLPEG